jgi:acyl-CoA reductase-like NAD-dependent aldehyde dehydrogenase
LLCKKTTVPFDSSNTVDSCHSASAADVDEAVVIDHEAYKSGVWSKASRQVRADVLDKIAQGLQASLDLLIPLEVLQTGRAIREMKAQVPSLVKWFKYYASVLRVEERPVLPTSGKLHNWVERVPIGVVAQITPLYIRLFMTL